MPHHPRGCSARYGYKLQASWSAWEKHFNSGKCNEIQSQLYQPKSVTQLFNKEDDPWYVKNLSYDKQYQKTIEELSSELDRWMVETRDIELIPEPMFSDLIGKWRKMMNIPQIRLWQIKRLLYVAMPILHLKI